jgi:alpha-L-fucosidase
LNYKTSKTLIRELVKVVSRDGNYLLNIGPKGDGTISEQTIAILNGFGDWIKINSESIYGTSRSPFSTEPKWGFFTKKTGRLYAHVFVWPANGELLIPSLSNSINRAYLLSTPETSLKYRNEGDHINISIPKVSPNDTNSVVVIDVTGVPSSAIK